MTMILFVILLMTMVCETASLKSECQTLESVAELLPVIQLLHEPSPSIPNPSQLKSKSLSSSLATTAYPDSIPPELTYSVENQNQLSWTNLTFDHCVPRVKFLCTAKYPVEWIEIYDKNINELTDIQHRIHKDMWTDRIVNESSVSAHNSSNHLTSIDASDSSSYSAFLGLDYTFSQKPFCFVANFSCRSVSNLCLQSNIISHVDSQKEVISFYHSDNILQSFENDDEQDNESCEAMITVSTKYDSPGWKCTGLKDHPREILPSYIRICDGAMSCNNFFQRFRKKSCVNRLSNKTEDCFGCRYLNKSTVFNPGHIWCTDNNEVIAAVLYFYSVPQTIGPKRIPELYLSWNEADPQKMLYLEPLKPNHYTGEQLTVFCQVSRFYFSFGHTFGFEFKNGTIWYTRHLDGQLDKKFNVNRMNKTIIVDSDLTRIYCLAPVWNSTKWINQSVSIAVSQDGTAPAVFVRNMDGLYQNDQADLRLTLHSRNVTLSCIGTGLPPPNISWTKDDAQFPGSTREEEPGRIDLIFPYVTYSVKGTYECQATNFLGKNKKTVKISVRDEFALMVQLSGIFIFFIIAGFVVILILCWKKIRQQRRQLWELTDAEIQEFREGNLEILDASEYLDTEELLLHALPYNDEYEISKERLYIDMSVVLGTGNFGQVVKGEILDRMNKRKSIEVAVKMVKSNHNIAYFKSLLSEVKIMAYLGHHVNVVSLVGACTANIKKREIFIAVEYCRNGSLEKFLKKSRPSFINLVSNEMIYIASLSENGNKQNHAYENVKESSNSSATDSEERLKGQLLQNSNGEAINNDDADTPLITTVHLLKWSREIANGMEFLGSRKIIHGDLASRNILLTQSLVAKIGDFGLSRQLLEYTNYVRSTEDDCPFLPYKWMSFETLYEGKFSVKSDVWSFGVTLWEIFTLGNLPYPGQTYSSRFLEELKSGVRLHKPTYSNSQIYSVMLECWLIDSSNRPSFTDLKDFFEGLLVHSCNDEYLETNSLQSMENYVNLNNASSNRQVQNPSYSVLGNIPETGISNSNTIVDFKMNIRTLPISSIEDTQGYLQPLMFETFEIEH